MKKQFENTQTLFETENLMNIWLDKTKSRFSLVPNVYLKLKNGWRIHVAPISHVHHHLFNRHFIVVVLIISFFLNKDIGNK